VGGREASFAPPVGSHEASWAPLGTPSTGGGRPGWACGQPWKQEEAMSAKLAHCIGAAARAARNRAKLTQADVAERVGVATEVYGRMERGCSMPSVPTLRKVALVLGVSTDELLGLKAEGSGLVRQLLPEDEPPEVRRLVRRVRAMKPARRRLLAVLARELVDTEPR
jgi:transcriptional regulator with XRE-family HTH domain